MPYPWITEPPSRYSVEHSTTTTQQLWLRCRHKVLRATPAATILSNGPFCALCAQPPPRIPPVEDQEGCTRGHRHTRTHLFRAFVALPCHVWEAFLSSMPSFFLSFCEPMALTSFRWQLQELLSGAWIVSSSRLRARRGKEKEWEARSIRDSGEDAVAPGAQRGGRRRGRVRS